MSPHKHEARMAISKAFVRRIRFNRPMVLSPKPRSETIVNIEIVGATKVKWGAEAYKQGMAKKTSTPYLQHGSTESKPRWKLLE